jgi:hypothetical protein
MLLMSRIKKMTCLTIVSASCLITMPAFADDPAAAAAGATGSSGGTSADSSASTGYLQQIAQYTNGILQAVNNVPTYLMTIAASCSAWLNPDTSDNTAKLQATFANFSNQMYSSYTAQLQLQPQIMQDFFGTTVSPTSLPNANDLTFTTLLGAPYFNPDPRVKSGGTPVNAGYNYIENASGVNVGHVPPGTNWIGTPADQLKYSNFYNLITSVTSYNVYVMSQLLTDSQANLSASQIALLQQASTSTWFANIASEQIGAVLRQILMYNSESFVLLSQLLQTQKEALISQAMTNTLLINNSSVTESLLLKKASTKVPAQMS